MPISAKRIWTPEQIQNIIDLYVNRHWYVSEIAKKYATKPEKISKILIENGAKEFCSKQRSKNRFLDEHYFNIIDTHDKAYFLGLILADGSVDWSRGHQKSFRIELVETDKYILDYLKNEIRCCSSYIYNKRAGRKHGTFCFAVRSDVLCDGLAQYGVIPNKTYSLCALPRVNSEFVPDMVRGLIDGDGSIYKDKSWHINFTGHNYDWVYSFMDTVRRLIGKERVIHPTNYRGIHKIIFNGKDAAKIIEAVGYLDSECVIPRKRSLAIRAYNEIMGKDIVCAM